MISVQRLNKDDTVPSMANTQEINNLFKQFPYSNIYNQWQLFDSEISLSGDVTAAYDLLAVTIEPQLLNNIIAVTQAGGKRKQITTFLLAAYHLLVQIYLADEESVLGVRHFGQYGECEGQQNIALSASYYYWEEDVTVVELLTGLDDFGQDFAGIVVAHKALTSAASAQLPMFYFDVLSSYDNANDDAVTALAISPVSLVLQPTSTGMTFTARILKSITPILNINDFVADYLKVCTAMVASGEQLLADIHVDVEGRHQPSSQLLDDAQTKMKNIWHQVLGVDVGEIEPDSCYFELGGTSLNAFLLVNTIRAEFNQDINIRNIVENSTLKGLSQRMTQNQ